MNDSFERYLKMIAKLYDSLSDEESRSIFRGRFNSALSGREEELYKELHSKTKRFHSKEIERFLALSGCDTSKIAVCGTGFDSKCVKYVLECLGYSVSLWVSGEYIEEGQIIENIPVVTFQELVYEYKEYAVIIASREKASEYYEGLLYLNFPREQILLPRKRIVEAKCGIQYFDLEYLFHEKDEIFIDCGAYNGDTIVDFLTWSNAVYKKIYAFEIDSFNYKSCKETISRFGVKNIEVINKGLLNKDGFVLFQEGRGSGSHITKHGNTQVPVTTIDNYLKGEKATFIKMDIEGCELAALMGAENTIKKFHPKLAIAIYHKPNDIIEIPLYIWKIAPDYKFYFRHYRASRRESVLYAIHNTEK